MIVEKLRELLSKGTQGKRRVECIGPSQRRFIVVDTNAFGTLGVAEIRSGAESEADAELYATVVNALPELLDIVEAAMTSSCCMSSECSGDHEKPLRRAIEQLEKIV